MWIFDIQLRVNDSQFWSCIRSFDMYTRGLENTHWTL